MNNIDGIRVKILLLDFILTRGANGHSAVHLPVSAVKPDGLFIDGAWALAASELVRKAEHVGFQSTERSRFTLHCSHKFIVHAGVKQRREREA